MRLSAVALCGLVLGWGIPALAGDSTSPALPAAPVPAPASSQSSAPPVAPGHQTVPSTGDVPFVLGVIAGRKEAEFSGRPLLLYFASSRSIACEKLAAEAFEDPQVVRTAAKFVPVLVDGDGEKEFASTSRVDTLPTLIFLNPKGEEVDRVQGVVSPAALGASMDAALLKMTGIAPTRAARDLDRADAELAGAREKGDWLEVCRALLAIEKIGHEGPAMARARAAREAAEAEGKKRIVDATGLVKAGKDEEAAQSLRSVAREFEGIDAGAEAKSLLALLESPPASGGGDDGTGDKKGKGGALQRQIDADHPKK